MTMAHYHVGHSIPGCLPESEPYCTDSAEDAMRVWHSNAHDAADALEDDGPFLEADTAQALTTVADLEFNGAVYAMIDGRNYWAETYEGTHADCEAAS